MYTFNSSSSSLLLLLLNRHWRQALSAGVVFGINGAGFLYTLTTRAHTLTDACGVGAFAASAVATYALHRSTYAGVAAGEQKPYVGWMDGWMDR